MIEKLHTLWLPTLAGVVAAVSFTRLAQVSMDQLAAPFPLAIEDAILRTVLLVRAGVNVYSPDTYAHPPFNVMLYTPAFAYLTASLPLDPANRYFAPRLLAMSFMLAAPLFLFCTRRDGFWYGLLASGTFFFASPVVQNTAFLKNDSMALFAAAAVVVASRAASDRGVPAILAALLCFASMGTKQSYIAAPLACASHLWLKDRALFRRFLGTLCVSSILGAALAQAYWGAGFWWSVFVLRPHPPELRPTAIRANRALALPLFIAAASFYLLTNGGYIDGPDGVVMFRVTQSFARGSLEVEPLASWPEHGNMAVDGGKRFYAWFAPGLSVAALPAYLIGRSLVPFAAVGERDMFDFERRQAAGETGFRFRMCWYDARAVNFAEAFTAFVTSWTNAFVTAGTLMFLLWIALDLGYGRGTALVFCLLAAAASPLWPYAKQFFSEPLAGLGLTGFLYYAIRARRGRAANWACAGTLLSVTVTTRVTHAVFFMPATMLVLADCRGRSRREAMPRLASFAATGSLGFAVVGLYDLARFGDLFQTGYGQYTREWTTPFFEGFAGLLVSPGRGLLIYCPLVLLSLMGVRRFAERAPRELAFIVASFVLLVGLYSKWFLWEGGWGWGPRFLVPLVPLLILPSVSLLERFSELGRTSRMVALSVIALAFVITALGAATNFVDYHVWVRAHFLEHQAQYQAAGAANYYALHRWNWRFAPPLFSLTVPSQSFLLPFALSSPGIILGAFGLFLAGLLGGLWRLQRALRNHQPA